jgi:hypothetical protein
MIHIPKLIIGFIGKAGAGKTTVANYLIQKYNFKIFSFAEPLKQMIVTAGMCKREELYGVNKTENARWLMQKLGTEIFRNQVDPDYWVKRGGAIISLLLKLGDVVIDDVRFPNEAQYISDKGGLLVRVVRDGHKGLEGEYGEHASEQLQDSIIADYVISAPSGDLQTLYYALENILNMEYVMQVGKHGYNA